MHVLHVLVGTNEEYDLIQSLDETAEPVYDWVVPKTASSGATVIFFFHKAGFAASGKVASKKPREGESRGRPAYRSDIDSIERFARPVHLDHIQQAVPSWGWLNQRSKSRTTPTADIAAALLKAIRAYK